MYQVVSSACDIANSTPVLISNVLEALSTDATSGALL